MISVRRRFGRRRGFVETVVDEELGVPRHVIVGASAAGLSAARELRSCGFSGDLTVVDRDRHAPYERPPLSKRLFFLWGWAPAPPPLSHPHPPAPAGGVSW